MKRIVTLSAVATLTLFSMNLSAGSWLSNALSSETVSTVVSSVTGGSTVTTSSISGTWTYASPAVEFESDNALTSAAASLTTSSIETKLASLYTKAGIKQGAFSFTFNSDSSFSCTVSGKSLSGTYSINGSALTLNFTAVSSINLGSLTTQTTLSGSSLSLLFQADELLTFVSKVASISSNDTLSAISSIIDQYNGLKLGFDLSK